MAQKLVVGNWKMNGSLAANVQLVESILEGAARACDAAQVLVGIAPPAVYLSQVAGLLAQQSHVLLVAQDVSTEAGGAFTGDVSANMLADFGVRYVIVGHSERRRYQHETDAGVAAKAAQAQRVGITPIVCLGETLEQRDAGQALSVTAAQLQAVISHPEIDTARLVFAYEPVWAIGTGRTATPAQAQEVHAALRRMLAEAMGEKARTIPLLYGGSMNAGNAAELLVQQDIDGGLIGGAALKPVDFLTIVASAASA